MRRWLILAGALALAGCEPQSEPPEPITQDVELHVHWSDTDERNAVAEAHGDAPNPGREGYAVLRERSEGYTCDIYVDTPRSLSSAEQELIGHELMHCLFGEYH